MIIKSNSATGAAGTERIDKIKRLVVIAMFADDELMGRFVLKGGNAIDIAYKTGSRASLDIDLSMEGTFKPEEVENIRQRIAARLHAIFQPEGYTIFDVKMAEQPEHLSEDMRGFGGGYSVSFK